MLSNYGRGESSLLTLPFGPLNRVNRCAPRGGREGEGQRLGSSAELRRLSRAGSPTPNAERFIRSSPFSSAFEELAETARGHVAVELTIRHFEHQIFPFGAVG